MRKHLELAFVAASLVAVASVVTVIAPSVALAATDAEQADALFKKGTKLFDDGKVDEACEALEESERLDHNGSTLYNLAICRAEQGKTASAYAAYSAALVMAQAKKNAARTKACAAAIEALEPKLSKISIVVPSGVATEGFEVLLDGKRVDPGEWGQAHIVDPGQHAIEAKATGKKAFTASVSVAKLADRVTITIPALVEDAPTTTAASPSATTSTTTPTSAASDVAPSTGSSQRTLGYVVGAAGIVVAGVGGYFLVHAESLRSDADAAREASDVLAANDLLADARKNRTLGFIGVGVGVAAIGTGIVLLVTAKSNDAPPRVQLVPTVGPSLGALSLVGRF
ncbi:MAG: hypothetical protein ABI175_08840 [Polyangiales bacterium]